MGSGEPGPKGRKSSKDAIGATAFLTANRMRQRADVFAGGSYASTSDLRLHFGLGATAPEPVALEVHWPSGRVETFPATKVDGVQTVLEGTGKLLPANDSGAPPHEIK